MVEAALYVATGLAGAGIAWAYQTWRAQPAMVSLQSELAALRTQHDFAEHALEAAQAATRHAEESWRGEMERRSVAFPVPPGSENV